MVFRSPPNSNGLAVSTSRAGTNPPLTQALALGHIQALALGHIQACPTRFLAQKTILYCYKYINIY